MSAPAATAPHSRVVLSALTEGVELPTEFRLFAAGVNETTKGSFIFDEAAAASVMAAYSAQGVDLAIDLEHMMMRDPAESLRADSSDARGWCKLELRNGELWAVNVRWTPDGERRLREKTQRYTSPAFLTDKEGRVIEIINVALVAMPATHNNAPLVAASRADSKTASRVFLLAALLAAATYNPKVRTPVRTKVSNGSRKDQSGARRHRKG